jgi:nitrite reductase/ring-hydroxylating ferredoxin subunit
MSETQGGLEPHDYFVICSADEVSRGVAKAFDLAEADGQGGSRPFRILVARNDRGDFFVYRNACPHQGVWLNIGAGKFFDETGALLQCGRHGATFAVETGECLSGACEGAHLEKVAAAVLDGDVCVHGVALLEEDFSQGHPEDMEETMEITIHP